MTITLFVYGTLKSGRWTTAREANGEQAAGLAEGRHCRRQGATHHDRFCRHALYIRPATTVGRLYDLPVGVPALEIPQEEILANGTGDPLANAYNADPCQRQIESVPLAAAGSVHFWHSLWPHFRAIFSSAFS